MQIKKFNKSTVNTITLSLLALSLFLLMIAMSSRVSIRYGGSSIWQTASFFYANTIASVISYWLIGFFIFDVLLLGVCLYQTLSKRVIIKKITIINIYLNIALLVSYLFLSLALSLYAFPIWILLMFGMIANIAAFFTHRLAEEKEEKNEDISYLARSKFSNIAILVVNTISIIFLFISLSIPFFTKEHIEYSWLGIFKGKDNYTIDMYIVAITLLVVCTASLIIYILTITDLLSNNKRYFNRSNLVSKLNLGISAALFLTGYTYCFIYRIMGVQTSTLSHIPFLIMSILSVSSAYFQGRIKNPMSKDKKVKGTKSGLKIIPLLFLVLFTAITICSIFVNFLQIDLEIFRGYFEHHELSGLDLLKDYRELKGVFQVFAFTYFLFLFTSGMLLLISLFSYFGKSRDYYKIVKNSIYANISFLFILAMIGVFFIFNQKIVDVYVQVALEYFGVVVPTLYTYTIKSQTIFVFIGSLALLLVMLVTRQLNHKDSTEKDMSGNVSAIEHAISQNNPDVMKEIESYDPCPAFSELDSLKHEFDSDLKKRRKDLFEDPSLPKIIGFVVNYARNSRLHLSYSFEDMATFVAGLGSSRLAILQGLSGTGKTSLPKIFTEAIMGNCDLVEVESSWRDKNELLGYYNEFSKRFTPRKFTQALYKARLNHNIPTFIVLDEMNLSRVEYYFSDFLSLMESEEDKREIKLLNIKIAPNGDPNKERYLGLKDGHTIKIPTNVWFIGTANHDESTFEISDKVYDRAQTMSFFKRADRIRSYGDAMRPRFISYEILDSLFKEAKEKMEFDAENDLVVREVEKLLIPYNISFGNRAINQIEDFVKIYCACFLNSDKANINEILRNAVETILFSKLVRKLVTKQVDNKEKLANAFDKLQLYRCSAFIRQLNED